MTIQEAMKELKERYPGKYVAVRYELIMRGDGTNNKEISAYVAGVGWSSQYKNFRDAIDSLLAVPDIEPGISDDTL
jgi:hypothetical protein